MGRLTLRQRKCYRAQFDNIPGLSYISAKAQLNFNAV